MGCLVFWQISWMQVIQFISEVEVAIKSLAQDLSAIFPKRGIWFLICISRHLIPWLGFELVSRELHLLKGPFEDAVRARYGRKVLFQPTQLLTQITQRWFFWNLNFPRIEKNRFWWISSFGILGSLEKLLMEVWAETDARAERQLFTKRHRETTTFDTTTLEMTTF